MVLPAFDPAFLRFYAAALLKELSAAVAQQPSSSEACVYIEIKSIGVLKPAAMTSAFCELIEFCTGSWGWNGNTFG